MSVVAALRSSIRGTARRLAAGVDGFMIRRAASSGVLSSLYYGLFSRAFRREHRAVLKGRAMHAARESDAGSYLLRRNIHRLEKGLLMQPAKSVFALTYIGETVKAYEGAISGGKGFADDGEWNWAHDVLDLYFRRMPEHPVIDEARERFEPLRAPPAKEGPHVPRPRGDTSGVPVNIDDLLALAGQRKSVRWFLPEPVPREAIDRAVQVAACSPSACNRQAFVFRVFDEAESVQRVASLAMGTVGYAENIPVIIVVVGQMRAYAYERDRHLIYVDASLAAMGLVYALEAQRLSTCCINWPDWEERERMMSRELGLAADERPVMLIAVGYADPKGLVASSVRKPVEELRKYNFE